MFFFKVFFPLLAIVNPFGGAMITLLALTEGMTPKERFKIIRDSVILGLFVLVTFAILGEKILSFFGISIYSFKLAGGALLFKIAMDMMFGPLRRRALTKAEEEEIMEAPGIFPIGVPLLAGPGAITTVMIYSQDASPIETFQLILAILSVMGVTYLVLGSAQRVYSLIGRGGALVISRLMGLILGAIAAQFVVSGALYLVKEIY